MSFAGHGNWCGPGWSAGQYKNAEDLDETDFNVEAVDELDQICKNHDINIWLGNPNANALMWSEAASVGIKGKAAAFLVQIGGPPTDQYLRGSEEMVKNRYSKKKKELEGYEGRHRLDGTLPDDTTPQAVVPYANNPSILESELYHKPAKRQSNKRRFEDEEEEEYKEADNTEIVEAFMNMNGDFETPEMLPRPLDPQITREERTTQRSLLNSLDQAETTMQETTTEEAAPQLLALRSGDGGTNAGSVGNRETSVRYNSRAELGIFTETRTAYLPITFYLSVNRTAMNRSIPLHIRLDWPLDILSYNTLSPQGVLRDYMKSISRQRGLSNDFVGRNARGSDFTATNAQTANIAATYTKDVSQNRIQLYPFPVTIRGNTPGQLSNNTAPVIPGDLPLQDGFSSSGEISDDNVVPAYRRWYAKMYQYAHCMETDWKVTYIPGDTNEPFQQMSVFEGMDCVSTGNTDRIPTEEPYGRVAQWPYFKHHIVQTRSNENQNKSFTLSGKWVPNQSRPNKMIANEEDVKTWTKLGSVDFNDREAGYREDLTLMHYSNENSSNIAGYWNVRVDLQYKVQFKDLTNRLRWHGSGTGDVSLTSADCRQWPFPNKEQNINSQPEYVGPVDGIIKR